MSKKAYNEEWVFNREVQDTARRWGKSKLLLPEQVRAIGAAFPSEFYQPHLFVRIALFIFTCIANTTAAGLVFLAVMGVGEYRSGSEEVRILLGCLLCGGGSLLLLELLISSNHLFRSGVDNALLYLSVGYFAVAVAISYSLLMPHSVDLDDLQELGLLWPLLALLAVVMLTAIIRYADPLAAALTLLLYLGIVGAVVLRLPLGKALLPFALMLACAGSYWLVQQLTRRSDYLYYRPAVRTVKALTLACFYLAGNYLVVREANALLHDLLVSEQIRFAPLFYLFTVGIPLLYLYQGLRRADRIFLYAGLLSLVFSIYTYRFYRSVLPPEWALTLGGAFLILLSGWALRYLRPARHGLTSEPADSPSEFSQLNLESLVMSHVTETTMQPHEPGFQFGGGQSGGGGAEGKW
ncbi:hypothetical protein [Hymenobacter cellulosivorans]|uniref:DUF4401 domain-containing protein n=1 Tax=Hymenobacter cellulosivorans TaxID=2932249 RepID=A0ABY4F7I7_9BACT|nr:hypothetical protein [Hymenobacter cellulosivorans]UOQ52483.1 hypothetical protein MUN80_22365 [Hymenobacter cellulosivorans]